MARPLLRALLLAGVFALGLGVASAADAADVFRLATDLEVNGRVAGDVVVVAGDLYLGPEAQVEGDAIAVLGFVHRQDGASVAGKVIALPSLASLEPAAADVSSPGLRIGLFMIVAGLWLLVTTGLAVVRPAAMRRATRGLAGSGPRMVALGALALATLFAALVAVLGLGPEWGVPLAGTLMVIFVVFKAIGLAVGGAVIGRVVLRRAPAITGSVSIEVFVGVLVLLLLRLVPVVGGFLWGLVSIVALGVGVFSAVTVGSAALTHAPADLPGHEI